MSLNEDPSTWRLQTDGGIKYKLFEDHPRGSIESEDGRQTEQIIIQSVDWQAFLDESFPRMGTWGTEGGSDAQYEFAKNRQYPGLTSLRTSRVDHEGFPPGLPSDPWQVDTDAPDGTYSEFLLLTIEYMPMPFLQTSAVSGTDLLALPARGTWEDAFGISWDIEDLNIPLTQLVPEIEWTVRWSRVDSTYFPILLSKIRSMIGKSNTLPVATLRDAPAETVLFVGYNFKDIYGWRVEPNGEASDPAVEVEMKFLEKRVVDGNGDTRGHNHIYRPDFGQFQLLLKPDGLPVYESADLNELFTGNAVPADVEEGQ